MPPEGIDPEQVVELVDPDGVTVYRKAADVEKALAQGMRHKSTEEQLGGYRAQAEEDFYSTPAMKARTFVEGAAGSATLGLSDVLSRNLDDENVRKDSRLAREHNPKTNLAGSVAGAVGSALVPGAPVALAGKAGAAVTKGLGGGAVATGAGMALEGGILAGGTTAQEVALSEDDVTIDRIAATLGSNVLLGAGGGAVLGIAGKGAMVYGKAAAKGVLKSAKVVEDVKAGASATNIVDDVAKYKAATEGADSPYMFANDRSVLRETRREFKRALNNTENLAERPGQLIPTIQKERQAIKKAMAEAAEDTGLTARIAKEHAEIAADLGVKAAAGEEVKLSGKALQRYTDWSGVKGPKAGLAVPAETALAFKAGLEAGEVASKRAAALANAPALLNQLDALEASVRAAAKPKSSFIGDLVDRGLQGAGMSAAAGLLPGGPVGALGMMVAPQVVGKLKDLVTSRLLKASAESAARSTAAVDAFVNTATKVGKVTPPLASKVLAGVSFGVPKADPATVTVNKAGNSLISSYHARAAELQSQVTVTPDGRLVMKPEARKAMADRLAGVRALQPLLADKLETVAARRVEFLAAKLPKRPDIAAMQIGPDRWQPSDMDVRTFARFVAAVEDPGAVEERLAHGTVTPEDAEAYKAVYPERFEDFKRQIVERLPELRATLPYERKVALSIFTGVPVDPAMHPQVLRVLQSMYADEPGTEGGTMAPMAAPAFGSVSKPEATAAQKRAG